MSRRWHRRRGRILASPPLLPRSPWQSTRQSPYGRDRRYRAAAGCNSKGSSRSRSCRGLSPIGKRRQATERYENTKTGETPRAMRRAGGDERTGQAEGIATRIAGSVRQAWEIFRGDDLKDSSTNLRMGIRKWVPIGKSGIAGSRVIATKWWRARRGCASSKGRRHIRGLLPLGVYWTVSGMVNVDELEPMDAVTVT